jgi:hypothetical protein
MSSGLLVISGDDINGFIIFIPPGCNAVLQQREESRRLARMALQGLDLILAQFDTRAQGDTLASPSTPSYTDQCGQAAPTSTLRSHRNFVLNCSQLLLVTRRVRVIDSMANHLRTVKYLSRRRDTRSVLHHRCSFHTAISQHLISALLHRNHFSILNDQESQWCAIRHTETRDGLSRRRCSILIFSIMYLRV